MGTGRQPHYHALLPRESQSEDVSSPRLLPIPIFGASSFATKNAGNMSPRFQYLLTDPLSFSTSRRDAMGFGRQRHPMQAPSLPTSASPKGTWMESRLLLF